MDRDGLIPKVDAYLLHQPLHTLTGTSPKRISEAQMQLNCKDSGQPRPGCLFLPFLNVQLWWIRFVKLNGNGKKWFSPTHKKLFLCSLKAENYLLNRTHVKYCGVFSFLHFFFFFLLLLNMFPELRQSEIYQVIPETCRTIIVQQCCRESNTVESGPPLLHCRELLKSSQTKSIQREEEEAQLGFSQMGFWKLIIIFLGLELVIISNLFWHWNNQIYHFPNKTSKKWDFFQHFP